MGTPPHKAHEHGFFMNWRSAGEAHEQPTSAAFYLQTGRFAAALPSALHRCWRGVWLQSHGTAKGAPVMRSRRAASVVMRSYMSWVMEFRISMAFALMPRSGCTDVSTRRRYDRYESTCLFLRLRTGQPHSGGHSATLHVCSSYLRPDAGHLFDRTP